MPLFHPGWIAGALWRSSGCSSCNNGQDMRLFAFCERHRNRIAINEQRLMQATFGSVLSQMTTRRYEQTTQNNVFEYKSCKYLLRLKVTTNHCK